MENRAENPESAEMHSAPLSRGQAAAAQLPSDWQLDVEPLELISSEPGLSEHAPVETVEMSPADLPPPVPVNPPQDSPPPVPPTVAARPSAITATPAEEPPPRPDQIVEALLFAGGSPLTAEQACSAIRGLSAEAFEEIVTHLMAKYRRQRRPYTIRLQRDGYIFALRPEYRPLHERIYGGPREARLSQPALDLLSLVAYRQPVTVSELDALRGADSAALVRQLVRLGLISGVRRSAKQTSEAESTVTAYVTTPRFLELFQLNSLDDLPRLGEMQSE